MNFKVFNMVIVINESRLLDGNLENRFSGMFVEKSTHVGLISVIVNVIKSMRSGNIRI